MALYPPGHTETHKERGSPYQPLEMWLEPREIGHTLITTAEIRTCVISGRGWRSRSLRLLMGMEEGDTSAVVQPGMSTEGSCSKGLVPKRVES